MNSTLTPSYISCKELLEHHTVQSSGRLDSISQLILFPQNENLRLLPVVREGKFWLRKKSFKLVRVNLKYYKLEGLIAELKLVFWVHHAQ